MPASIKSKLFQLLLLQALAASPSLSATINVTPNSTSALRTAMSNARAGDTLILTGTYNLGSSGITTSADGTATNRITLTSNTGATLTGTTANAGIGINNDYWTVSNLNINGFVKSVRIDNANHGILDNLACTNSIGESIKLRNSSQYWLVANCRVTNSGAEGYYCGDADQNWVGGIPDQTGYVTFYNCTAIAPTNDGFDNKEGTHHIKIISCTVDWNNTTPGTNNLGNSGIYDRANHLQAIRFAALNNASLGNAVRSHRQTALDGIAYGSDTDLLNITASNLAGAAFYNSHLDTELYAYSLSNVTGGLLESGSKIPLTIPPYDFQEMTWDGEGGNRFTFPWIPEPANMGILLPVLITLMRRPIRDR